MRARRALIGIGALAVACATRVELPWNGDGASGSLSVRPVFGGVEVWWDGAASIEVTTNLSLAPTALTGAPPVVLPRTSSLFARVDGGPWISAAPVPVGNAGLGVHPLPAWLDSSLSASRFGFPIVNAGDVDGDGDDDVAFGANEHSSPEAEEGVAMLLRAGGGGLGSAIWTADSDLANTHFGKALAVVGDVTGDGIDDIAVGGSDWGTLMPGMGIARLYRGTAEGFSNDVHATVEGTQSNSWLGRHFAVGDLDCDGNDDWIVNEHGWNGPVGINQGRVLVFRGPVAPAVNATNATWVLAGDPNSLSGYGLPAHRGDVNGDGCDDLLVGAYLDDAGGTNAGSATLYYGTPFGPVASGWRYDGKAAGEFAGFALDFAGDLDGDGYDDIAVGVPQRNASAGAVVVFTGGPDGPSPVESLTLEGAPGEQLGRGVASARDVNGDGWGDLLVGAPAASENRGRAALHLGGPAGVSAQAAWEVLGPRPNAYWGGALETADVDGDGILDVLVGPVGIEGLDVVASAALFQGPPKSGPSLRIEAATVTAEVPVSLNVTLADARGPCTCAIDWPDVTDEVASCDAAAIAATMRALPPGDHDVRVRIEDAYGLRSEAIARIQAR